MIIWKELDLPHPPTWLIKTANSLLPPDLNNIEESLSHHLNGDKLKYKENYYNNINKKIQINDEIKDHSMICEKKLPNHCYEWVTRNIENNINNLILSWTLPKSNISKVHTDNDEGYVFMYILDSGGREVKTNFYKEKNKDLIREGRISAEYFNLELVDSIIIKPHCWTMFNIRILHDITGLEKSRVSIQARSETITNLKIL